MKRCEVNAKTIPPRNVLSRRAWTTVVSKKSEVVSHAVNRIRHSSIHPHPKL